jgi:catechol 2,3-dioxygenase-like lactoylglutathione lyase family enzyme
MSKIISGIQQLGIGVADVETSWKWYRHFFGMDVPVFQEAAPAPFMTRYTGGVVQSRTATLALNLQGGGGFEIWQYTSRTPQPPVFQPEIGDLGILAGRIKTRNVAKAHARMSALRPPFISELVKNPLAAPYFFVRDPFGNLFTVSESDSWFGNGDAITGGPNGAIIGVSDIDKARELYTDVLGYDVEYYDEEGFFPDLAVIPGGNRKLRRVLLGHSEKRKGPFSQMLGPSVLEFVQLKGEKGRKIFENRFWGDLGFIHLCFDIQGMQWLKEELEAKGFPFTVDSGTTFDMGDAGGHFTYVEDPDGTLIEFVETHKMPIAKKFGVYIDLKKRNPVKPLPAFLLKLLRFNRRKD